MTLAERAGLRLVPRVLRQLRGFVRLMRLDSGRHPTYMAEVLVEHEALVEALERHDPNAAAAALAHHLHRSHYTP